MKIQRYINAKIKKMTSNISKVFQICQQYEKHSYKLHDRNTDIKSYKTMDKPKRINQINLNTTVSYFSVKVSSIIIFFRNNLSYKNTDITLSIKY